MWCVCVCYNRNQILTIDMLIYYQIHIWMNVLTETISYFLNSFITCPRWICVCLKIYIWQNRKLRFCSVCFNRNLHCGFFNQTANLFLNLLRVLLDIVTSNSHSPYCYHWWQIIKYIANFFALNSTTETLQISLLKEVHVFRFLLIKHHA